MLAAVQTTDEPLTAPRYLMQFFACLAFSYTKPLLMVVIACRHNILYSSQSESDLH